MDRASFINGFFFARTLLETVFGKISHSKLRERLNQVTTGDLSLIDSPEEIFKEVGTETGADKIPPEILRMMEEEYRKAMANARPQTDANNIMFAKIISEYLDELERRFPIKKD